MSNSLGGFPASKTEDVYSFPLVKMVMVDDRALSEYLSVVGDIFDNSIELPFL